MAKESKQEPFEQLYARLEESVNKLEQGGLALDEAIALYEQGMALARTCQERLDEAEQRITKLKESFAPVPARADGAVPDTASEDYEYVPEDAAGDEEDPFA